MSGQPNRYAGDAEAFREEYMDYMRLEIAIDKMNFDANRVYQETGQLPPVSQLKDNRTTDEILKDTFRLKQNLVADLEGLGSLIFRNDVVEQIMKSPLNTDGSLLTYFSQRAREITDRLKSQYKYGIKGDKNDVETIVRFIENMYNQTKDTIGTVKQYFDRPQKSSFLRQIKGDEYKDIIEAFDKVKMLFLQKADNKGSVDLFNEIYRKLGLLGNIFSGKLKEIDGFISDNVDGLILSAGGQDFYDKWKEIKNLIQELPNSDTLISLIRQLEKSIMNSNQSLTNNIMEQILNQLSVLDKLDVFIKEIEIIFGTYTTAGIPAPAGIPAGALGTYGALGALGAMGAYGAMGNNQPNLKGSMNQGQNNTEPMTPYNPSNLRGSVYQVQPNVGQINQYNPQIADENPLYNWRNTEYGFNVDMGEPISRNVNLQYFNGNQVPPEEEAINNLYAMRNYDINQPYFMENFYNNPNNPIHYDLGQKQIGNVGRRTINAGEMSLNLGRNNANTYIPLHTEGNISIPLIGHGVKRSRGRPKGSGLGKTQPERVVENADFNSGIDESPRYIKFGNLLLNNQKLHNDNILMLKRIKGGNIPELPSKVLSTNLSGIIKKMIGGSVPTFQELEKLSNPEKLYLHKIASKANINDKFSIPTPSKDEYDKLLHDFQVQQGEIMAGNDSKELIKSFKINLLKLSSQNLLPKNQVQEILTELLEMGL